MKLFIWIDPYVVKYGQSRFMAVAEDVEQARKLAQTCPSFMFGNMECDNHRDDPSKRNSVLDKEPTRIVDLPCAEWDYFSE